MISTPSRAGITARTCARTRVQSRAMLSAALLAVVALTLPACSPVIVEHGYVFDAKDVAKVKEGETKAQVIAELGSPSTVSTVEGQAWYYISSTIENYAWYPPEETDRKIMAVYFDKTDIVQRVAFYGLKDGQIVDFVSRTTPTRGKELTVLQQMFSNVGKFNSATPTGGKGATLPGAGGAGN